MDAERQVGSAVVGSGECRYPGCRNPRRPRENRRGAPPAYCDVRTHEPDAARRERSRRQRVGLPLDEPLEGGDLVLDDVDRAREEVRRTEVTGDATGRGGGEGPSPSADRGAVDPGASAEGGPQLSVPVPREPVGQQGPAERARRTAAALALASEAVEALGAEVTELQAEVADLRTQLRRAETLLAGRHR